MDRDEVKLGQVVYLNSGSPPLTVTDPREPICVRWINKEGEQEATFPAACLTPTQTMDWNR